jgi:hypothetical protein
MIEQQRSPEPSRRLGAYMVDNLSHVRSADRPLFG